MDTRPLIDRQLLHPASNRSVAMNPDGTWLSYSCAPVAGESGWVKQTAETVCFRIPVARAPKWAGKWQDSLVVFEDEKV